MKLRSRLLALAAFAAGLAATAHAETAKPQAPAAPQMDEWHRQYEERLHNDWAFLARYARENASLAPAARGENRVVFMGDSITEGWKEKRPAFFQQHPYLDRGISGQTTPQMLVRFRPDVIDLKPRVVLILAGTNDIAGNTGPMTLDQIESNVESMVDLAHAHHIRVVLCSVLPTLDYPWRPGMNPAPKIAELNLWLRAYAQKRGCVYLDYFSSMAAPDGSLRKELTHDGVHPNEAGYDVMAPLAMKAIEVALTIK